MRIAILVSMINNFGEKGFYNSQEIGMAKQIAKQGHEVIVYKLLSDDSKQQEDLIIMDNLCVKYYCVKSLGINGIIPLDILDKDIDGLLFFSDTQLAVPKVYKWCIRNNIKFVPYIGVIESHSNNRVIKAIMNTLFLRNLNVFKKCDCLLKNEDVLKRLSDRGVKKIQFSPVGIDLDLMNKDYDLANISGLKRKWNFDEKDKIILFIGRLEDEKRPIDLIYLFQRILESDSSYKLLIVGKGSLKEQMLLEVKKLQLNDVVRHIEKIPNSEVWELYRLCDVFVNLNKHEIFGMVLLEAMYYECKVVAWEAPGPNHIIENGVSGYLVSGNDELISCIKKESLKIGDKAHKRVVEQLTWAKTASLIVDTIKSGK